jgi:tetratricopeptide (TPR) repeat protein
MCISPRIRTRLFAAWGMLLLANAPCAFAGDLAAAAGDSAAAGNPVAAGDAELLGAIGPVRAHAYAGADTAALLARIQERLKWGEKDERLIEAEGILRLDRGENALAAACFAQLSAPGPATLELEARALDANGDKYEAAARRLRAARALPPADPEAVVQYRRYLAVRPTDEQAEVELAVRLETQMAFGEAMDLYWKHRERLARDAAGAARAADLLAVHGRLADAAALLAQARESAPSDKALGARLAGLREALGDLPAAADIWVDLSSRDPADTATRARALAALEAVGPAGEARYRDLLEKDLQRDTASADLHFRMAGVLIRAGDRKGAYAHLDRALKASPGDPACLERLPEAIEGDSLIRVHAALIEDRFRKDPASPRLALLAGRAYSLAGEHAEACRAWIRLAEADPKAVEGRRDAFLDLAACGDPASSGWAILIGSKQLAAGFESEAARTLILLELKAQDYQKAAGYAALLAAASPADAPRCLGTARALLAAGKEALARQVLAALADRASSAEAAFELGRLHWAAHECAQAAPRLRAAGDSFPEARRLLGECLSAGRDYAGAAAAYESHFARTGDKASLRAAARLRHLAGDLPKEAEAWQTLEDNGWASETERLRLGLAKAALGDARGATAQYENLFRGRAALPAGEGDDAGDWRQAALQYGMQMAHDGQLDKAVRALGMGLKAAPAGTPGLSDAWLRLGECLAEKKQWREAYGAYAAAFAADSGSDEAALEMLECAKRFDGKAERALALKAVYRVDTLNAEANAALGAARQAAHEYREAAKHYRRVADAHPSDPGAWENLGNALALIPDLKAASGPLQTAIDLGAQSDEVYINRARAYRAEGEKRMAASILHFLLSRNPRDYLAVLWSAKFAEEDGYAETASDLFRKTATLQAPRSSWPELTEARAQASREAKTASRAD